MGKYHKLQDLHFSDFADRVYTNGILKIELKSWDEFCKIAQIFSDNSADYIWRGHRDDTWKLTSFFDRESSKGAIPHFTERQDKLDEILKTFKQRLKELLHININCTDENKIWAIGQHYGLPTPLLDWTTCPYTATFIAFYKKGTNNRVVYALSLDLKRRILKHKKTGKNVPFIDFLDLTSTCDDMQNERLKAQKGRFTKALNGTDIKTNVSNYSNNNSDIVNAKDVILAEIFISEKERDNCLNYLQDEKGITHGRLFPDYPGAVDICKHDLGINSSCSR